MRIAWLSDTHLDHARTGAVIDLGAECSQYDATIVTGDISTCARFTEDMRRLTSKMGHPCYFVLGNHDAWGGSLEELHKGARNIEAPFWLKATAPVHEGDAAIIGVDGWYDCGAGDAERSSVFMNDWRRIAELREALYTGQLLQRCSEMGEWSAAEARRKVEAAIESCACHILLATHVPPFREACLYAGKVTDDAYAPFYVNHVLGLELRRLAGEHPDVQFTVIAGHTHHAADVEIAPNLRCHVAHAEYGKPAIAGVVTIDEGGIRVEQ